MSETITAPRATPAPNAEYTVTDSLGRHLVIREIGPLEQLDLFEACAQNSTNTPWVGMALLACSVITIDGFPRPMPRNPDQVRAAVRLLGKPGIAAAAAALSAAEQSDVGQAIDLAKN